MATYTEKEEVKLEIIPPYNIIQCRIATIVLRDGEPVGTTYNRTVYNPGGSLDDAPVEVIKCAQALWTTEIVNAYRSKQEEIDASNSTSVNQTAE